ncbi:protein POLLENLESS 3 [Arachis ipaensis]|uniref:protein POLLENLESS 3 n=1 Tax=Arachis ipaensis TaxID=130454 RepID=UPI000A2B2934|nr:protein POLLENLESS 3 [Arachis ipaensis]
MMFERSSPARCFVTPPQPQPSWTTRHSSSSSSSPNMALSESESKTSPLPSVAASSYPHNKDDLFHVIHKVPAGDSPYVKAKQVQLVDKDPARSISMFWAAINAGDRVESALKDMALVMKQLNRSDEAIEAIKSFRHLCLPESQESLDNILVELYKRSGRVDEEIAMLHHKLKQIEDGITFVGRSTKQARSQGRKIQITAEQEISRILGNLAWAYLQRGDYKIAEEHYRKALSFEVDRNKQCNLAICLMQMNKITEAKFLLQAVTTATKNRKMDDSFVKSYERATQMLSEMGSLSSSARNVSQCSPQNGPVDEPKKAPNIGNLGGRNWEVAECKTENWSSTSEVEASNARRRLYESPPDPAKRDQKVPYNKPKRCSWGFSNNGYQRETWGDFHSDHRSSFGSPNDLSAPPNGKWRAGTLDNPPADGSNQRSKPSESPLVGLNGDLANVTGKSQDSEISSAAEKSVTNVKTIEKKSWADIAEEEENEEQDDLFSGAYANYGGKDSGEVNDENANSNILCQQQPPGNGMLSRNPTVRRSLCFNPEQRPESASKTSASASNSESRRMPAIQSDSSFTRRNRLQVFQDITLQPETP